MDAMDILGSLLGGGSRGRNSGGNSGAGGGLGGKILGELLKGAVSGQRNSPAESRPSRPGSNQPATQASRSRDAAMPGSGMHDIEREARSLEELLGVATGSSPSSSSHRGPSAYRPAPEPSYRPRPGGTASATNQPPLHPAPPRTSAASSTAFPSGVAVGHQPASMTRDDEAVVLIRALINAAKADGRIDANEQQAILNQVGNDPRAIEVLKQEFGRPLDVREFAWSVPLGMEVQVYTMSLAGMLLDTREEARYLAELAHGLRLDPGLCQQIHARYGVADIF